MVRQDCLIKIRGKDLPDGVQFNPYLNFQKDFLLV